MSQRIVDVIVKGKDEASAALSGVTKAAGVLATGIGAIVTTAGVATIAVGKAVYDWTTDVASMDASRATFDGLATSIGGTEEVLGKLRTATNNTVTDFDLMGAANKFLLMGITETADETARMSEVATTLGAAMGSGPTESMENFALMMANQSIPRLDSFGISSAAVRERIAELTAETEGLSKEEAFNIAVMEQAAVAMERVGDITDTATFATARWETAKKNLKDQIGAGFLPVMTKLLDGITPLFQEHGPKVIAWAGQAAEWLGDKVPLAIDFLTKAAGIMGDGLRTIKNIWDTALKPALMMLADTLGLDTDKIKEATSAQNLFEVALKIVEKGVGVVVTAIQLLTIGVHAGRQAIEWITGKVDAFGAAVNRIRDALQRMRDRVNEVRNALSSLSLPSWLTPGSPTPLELGLLGINNALAAMPAFNLGVSTSAGSPIQSASSGTVSIVNHFGAGSVRNDDDIVRIANQIAQSMNLRGARVAL